VATRGHRLRWLEVDAAFDARRLPLAFC